jgi:hypothetical protein
MSIQYCDHGVARTGLPYQIYDRSRRHDVASFAARMADVPRVNRTLITLPLQCRQVGGPPKKLSF